MTTTKGVRRMSVCAVSVVSKKDLEIQRNTGATTLFVGDGKSSEPDRNFRKLFLCAIAYRRFLAIWSGHGDDNRNLNCTGDFRRRVSRADLRAIIFKGLPRERKWVSEKSSQECGRLLIPAFLPRVWGRQCGRQVLGLCCLLWYVHCGKWLGVVTIKMGF